MVEKKRGDDEYDYDEPEEDTTQAPGGAVTP